MFEEHYCNRCKCMQSVVVDEANARKTCSGCGQIIDSDALVQNLDFNPNNKLFG